MEIHLGEKMEDKIINLIKQHPIISFLISSIVICAILPGALLKVIATLTAIIMVIVALLHRSKGEKPIRNVRKPLGIMLILLLVSFSFAIAKSPSQKTKSSKEQTTQTSKTHKTPKKVSNKQHVNKVNHAADTKKSYEARQSSKKIAAKKAAAAEASRAAAKQSAAAVQSSKTAARRAAAAQAKAAKEQEAAAQSSSRAAAQSSREAAKSTTGQVATGQGKIIGDKRSMIYHLPGQARYYINPSNAEYFNTEAEAIAAGFRKSKR